MSLQSMSNPYRTVKVTGVWLSSSQLEKQDAAAATKPTKFASSANINLQIMDLPSLTAG